MDTGAGRFSDEALCCLEILAGANRHFDAVQLSITAQYALCFGDIERQEFGILCGDEWIYPKRSQSGRKA